MQESPRISNIPTGVGRSVGRLVCCAGLNALLFAFLLTWVTPGFESGDDPAMMRIASGEMTGEPSDRLIFSSVLIGRVLQRLYLLAPAINWYANYLLATHYLATTALLWTLARLAGLRDSMCAYLLLLITFEVRLLVELQFTSTALLAGFAGALLVFSEMHTTAPRLILATMCGGVLMVLSAMIRPDAFYFAMLVVMPLAAIALWEWLPPISLWKQYLRRSSPWAVSLIVSLAVISYDHWSYIRDPEWKQFREYQKVRATLYDFSVLRDIPNARFFYHRIGWSHNDFNMFQHYYLVDEALSNAKTLSSLLSRFGQYGRSSTDSREHWQTYLGPVSPYFFLTLLNALLAIILGRGARARCIVYALYGAALLFVVFFYFSIYAKLATRVTIPAVFAFNAALLTAGFGMPRIRGGTSFREFAPLFDLPRRASFLRLLTGLAFAALYGVAIFQSTSIHAEKVRLNAGQQHAFEHLVDKIRTDTTIGESPPLFVTWGIEYPQNWAAPTPSGASALAKLATIGLGWNTHSPYYRRELANHEIDDIYRVLYERPDVYVFSSDFDFENMQTYVLEHHFQMIDSSSPQFYLYDYEPDVLPLYLRIRQFLLPAESKKDTTAKRHPTMNTPEESSNR